MFQSLNFIDSLLARNPGQLYHTILKTLNRSFFALLRQNLSSQLKTGQVWHYRQVKCLLDLGLRERRWPNSLGECYG